MKKDIISKDDIAFLIDKFYKNVAKEASMVHFFENVDWSKHLPKMIGFWEFILFSTPNAYTGSLMEPHFKLHERLPFAKKDFEKWLEIFNQTVDENFEGKLADEAKNAAFGIAATMRYKIVGSDKK
jgi:hemoglobin